MFLGVDIGNTHTVTGLYGDSGEILLRWRIRTDKGATADELASVLFQLCAMDGIDSHRVKDIIIACVVPPILSSWEEFSRRRLGKNAVVIQGHQDLGMPILCDHPHELGADRIVNAIAGFHRYRSPLIIVDYGTATTFDCVSSKGEYLGGAIAPGPLLAADALAQGTSRLPRIEIICRPSKVLGTDTVSAMQSGIVYGFAGLTEGLIARLAAEFPVKPRVIATGGLASVVSEHSPSIEAVHPDLTLEGLGIIYKRLSG